MLIQGYGKNLPRSFSTASFKVTRWLLRQSSLQLLSALPLEKTTDILQNILEVLPICSADKPPPFQTYFLPYLRSGCIDCSWAGLPRGWCSFLPLPPWSTASQQQHLEKPTADVWLFSKHQKHFGELRVNEKSRRMLLCVSLVLNLLFGVGKERECFGFSYNRDLYALFTQHYVL